MFREIDNNFTAITNFKQLDKRTGIKILEYVLKAHICSSGVSNCRFILKSYNLLNLNQNKKKTSN